MVIRSIETKRLILQANGGGGAGIIINSSNNTSLNSLTASGTITASNSVITNSTNNSLISFFHPTPANNGLVPTNLVDSRINLCCRTTAGTGILFPYLSVVCTDIANNYGTIINLSSSGQFWTGYNFNTRIVLDSSFATNSSLSSGGTINFQTSDTNNVSVSTFQNICTMDTNNVRMFKSPRTINCNYENEGQLISHGTLINTGGSALDGYFIPVAKYTNSILLCSFTHDSFNYVCWGGHITIGKTNSILNITAPIYGFQLQVEAFVQQTTLLHFIRARPTTGYQNFVQLRAKIYG